MKGLLFATEINYNGRVIFDITYSEYVKLKNTVFSL